jgi:hypothetical protein
MTRSPTNTPDPVCVVPGAGNRTDLERHLKADYAFELAMDEATTSEELCAPRGDRVFGSARNLALAKALRLPTLEHAARRYSDPVAIIARDGLIAKVFYLIGELSAVPRQVETWLRLNRWGTLHLDHPRIVASIGSPA